MKNLIWIIIVAALVIILVILSASYSKRATANHSGSLYVSVTDASSSINNVKDINMSVEKVEIHSKEKGWMTVAMLDRVYPLLSLKQTGVISLYAWKGNIDSGYYDKARVTLGNVMVRTKTNTSLNAALPSKDIEIDIAIRIKDNESSNLKLDFLADKSLHLTSDGKYIFTPVIKANTRGNVETSLVAEDQINISGGTAIAQANVGIDMDGKSRSNFQLILASDVTDSSKVNPTHTAANITPYKDKNPPIIVKVD